MLRATAIDWQFRRAPVTRNSQRPRATVTASPVVCAMMICYIWRLDVTSTAVSVACSTRQRLQISIRTRLVVVLLLQQQLVRGPHQR